MDKYERIRVVGRGAFGTVYLCRRLSDRRQVIVKQIPVEQLNKLDRQSTVNEVRVLAMLRHPNIIAYHESFLQDQAMMIVMEYAAGGTLYQYLEEQTTYLDEPEIAHLFAQIVLPLHSVHRQNVLHRDLKSQNIFLTRSRDHVKIGDFGISKILSSKSKAYTVVGTPCYISPELCEGRPYDQKSDLWALGCVLYELCTLKRAFEAPTLPALVLKIMRGAVAPLPAHYSPSLRELLASLLAVDPDQRPGLTQVMAHHWLAPGLYRLPATLGALPCTARPPRALSANRLAARMQDGSGGDLSPAHKKRGRSPSPFALERKVGLVLCWPSISASQLSSEDGQQPPAPLNLTQRPASSSSSSSSSSLTGLCLISRDRLAAVTSEGKVTEWTLQRTPKNAMSSSPPSGLALDGLSGIAITRIFCSGRDGDEKSRFYCLLTDRGILLTCGRGRDGCLGHGDTEDAPKPRIVEALLGDEVTRVACGRGHVCALTSDGDVFAWGRVGRAGSRLGLGRGRDVVEPAKVSLPPMNEQDEEAVVELCCGDEATLLLTSLGGVLAAGDSPCFDADGPLSRFTRLDRLSNLLADLAGPSAAIKWANLVGRDRLLLLLQGVQGMASQRTKIAVFAGGQRLILADDLPGEIPAENIELVDNSEDICVAATSNGRLFATALADSKMAWKRLGGSPPAVAEGSLPEQMKVKSLSVAQDSTVAALFASGSTF